MVAEEVVDVTELVSLVVGEVVVIGVEVAVVDTVVEVVGVVVAELVGLVVAVVVRGIVAEVVACTNVGACKHTQPILKRSVVGVVPPPSW